MATINQVDYNTHLNLAVLKANKRLNQGRISAKFYNSNANSYEMAKSPVLLTLNINDNEIPIGSTHIVHLVGDWNNPKTTLLIRTIDEISNSIIFARFLYYNFQEDPNVIFNERGSFIH